VRSARIALSQAHELLGVSEKVFLGLFSDCRVDADPATLDRVAVLLEEVKSELAAAGAAGRLDSDDALAAGVAVAQLFHACLVERTSCATGRPDPVHSRPEVLHAWHEVGVVLHRLQPDQPGPLVAQAVALLLQPAPSEGHSATRAEGSFPEELPASIRASLAPKVAALPALATGGGKHAAQAASSLAGLCIVVGELDSAEEYATQAVDELPPESAPWALMCILLGTNQRHAELEAVARRWMRADSTLDGRWALAKALAGQGETSAALDETQRILALDPHSPEPHLLVAALGLRLGTVQGELRGPSPHPGDALRCRCAGSSSPAGHQGRQLV